jgi:hypothetical protein
MAKSKDTIIKLLTSNGKTLEVSIDHAEKILFSRNNKKGLIKLDDDNFELTSNGLRKKSVKRDTKKSDK